MHGRLGVQDRMFISSIYVVLVLLAIATLYPFWSTLVLSLKPKEMAMLGGWNLFTTEITFDSYANVFRTPEIWRGFYNSVVRVLLGTGISVFLLALTAYPLSKPYFPFRKQILAVVLFTMIFNGGMIPTYLLIKSLKMMDTVWALVLPTAVTAYNLIIVRTFLQSIPASLEESAKLDGASDFRVWWQIVLPLCKPVLATVALWQAVSHWNAYLDVLLYINDRSKYVLQVILRRILLENEADMYISSMVAGQVETTTETVKSAIIIVSTLPIIMVYPFLQKYFVKGIMIGAIKE